MVFSQRMLRGAAVACLLSLGGCAAMNDRYPPVSDDGLERIEAKHVDAVYWAPDASLAAYDKVKLDSTRVAFKKNWLRDQNRDRIDLTHRVSAEDMERIQSTLAQAFTEVLARELEAGGYQVVEASGHDVLLLRPAIVDLDVVAPDTMSPGRSVTLTTETGEMTLNLEFYDAATGALIGRAIDRRRMDDNYLSVSNSITNRADAERIFRSWAKRLVRGLEEAGERTGN